MGDKGLEHQLERLVSMLADRQWTQAAPVSTPSIVGLTNSISEFSYDPKNGVTFESRQTPYHGSSVSRPTTKEDAVIAEIYVDDGITQQTSASNNTLRQAIHYVQGKWPKRSPTGDLQQLFQRRDSLCVIDSCLMFGERVVDNRPEPPSTKSTTPFEIGTAVYVRDYRLMHDPWIEGTIAP
ncbi:unnamed protein product [Mesocestoides corti]|uniref:MH2 domain-containing protein n=1 Tax=Mesocestoides corti TaxID=53468 RepID=A0A0R3UAU1_MESCO|nr:unnamed protein product [Mesocestoides corti]